MQTDGKNLASGGRALPGPDTASEIRGNAAGGGDLLPARRDGSQTEPQGDHHQALLREGKNDRRGPCTYSDKGSLPSSQARGALSTRTTRSSSGPSLGRQTSGSVENPVELTRASAQLSAGAPLPQRTCGRVGRTSWPVSRSQRPRRISPRRCSRSLGVIVPAAASWSSTANLSAMDPALAVATVGAVGCLCSGAGSALPADESAPWLRARSPSRPEHPSPSSARFVPCRTEDR